MSKKFRQMDPEEYTDTDKDDTNETGSNYSEEAEAEFSFSTQGSESEVSEKPPSLTFKRSATARKYTPRRAKVTPEETPVTPHRENTVENVQIPGPSAETRRLDRSFSKRSRMNSVKVSQRILAAKRKSREERDTSYENVRDKLQANRDRITSPTQAEDDDEIVPLAEYTPRQYKRQQPSAVWRHVLKENEGKIVQCKYCDKDWKVSSLCGSTSNVLKHLRVH